LTFHEATNDWQAKAMEVQKRSRWNKHGKWQCLICAQECRILGFDLLCTRCAENKHDPIVERAMARDMRSTWCNGDWFQYDEGQLELSHFDAHCGDDWAYRYYGISRTQLEQHCKQTKTDTCGKSSCRWCGKLPNADRLSHMCAKHVAVFHKASKEAERTSFKQARTVRRMKCDTCKRLTGLVTVQGHAISLRWACVCKVHGIQQLLNLQSICTEMHLHWHISDNHLPFGNIGPLPMGHLTDADLQSMLLEG
jgi:hypothetical protein